MLENIMSWLSVPSHFWSVVIATILTILIGILRIKNKKLASFIEMVLAYSALIICSSHGFALMSIFIFAFLIYMTKSIIWNPLISKDEVVRIIKSEINTMVSNERK